MDSRLAFASAGSIALLGFILTAALFSALPEGTAPEVTMFAVVVAVVSWWSTPATAAGVALVGYLFVSGFVFGQEGSLTWSGTTDLMVLGGLMLLALGVAILGGRTADHARRLRIRRSIAVLFGHHQGGHIHG